MTILVVDDELTYRLLMKTMLSADGHEILLAEDGEEALERLEEVEINIVISDIYMPVMDGFKFHKKIRSSEKWKNLPILFVSAYDDQHTREVIQDPKLEAFVVKGRPSDEIREWISYLTSPESERPRKLPGARSGARSAGL
jgi:CheY-like chemotaxis protein